jgi:hypothetical protein
MCLLAIGQLAPRTDGGLTGGWELAHAYDAALDADFNRARQLAAEACPPAPEPACRLLDGLIIWWRIQLDPDDPRHDARFLEATRAAIQRTEEWTRREPQRAEAWFYLGAARGALAQWQVLRGERLAAARHGRAIRSALDRALSLDPALDDARFGLGLYQYYAGLAPRLLRALRWLLLLPGGNRADGLALIERSHQAGGLVAPEAAYQLHVIYLWYERRHAEARALVDGLATRYPRSPLFPQLRASIDDVYLNDPAESRRGWEALARAAEAGLVHEPHIALARSRLALASLADRHDESDLALQSAEAVLQMPALPYGARAQALVVRGQAHDRLGDRAQAERDYQAARDAAPPGDPAGIAAAVERARRERPDPARARAYRLALEGWRALEAGDVDRAWTRLDEARALDPASLVTRYRRARALIARGAGGEALIELDEILLARPPAAPHVRILALLDAAALTERFGQIDRARALYEQASRVEGADRELRDRARRDAARLTPQR